MFSIKLDHSFWRRGILKFGGFCLQEFKLCRDSAIYLNISYTQNEDNSTSVKKKRLYEVIYIRKPLKHIELQ